MSPRRTRWPPNDAGGAPHFGRFSEHPWSAGETATATAFGQLTGYRQLVWLHVTRARPLEPNTKRGQGRFLAVPRRRMGLNEVPEGAGLPPFCDGLQLDEVNQRRGVFICQSHSSPSRRQSLFPSQCLRAFGAAAMARQVVTPAASIRRTIGSTFAPRGVGLIPAFRLPRGADSGWSPPTPALA